MSCLFPRHVVYLPPAHTHTPPGNSYIDPSETISLPKHVLPLVNHISCSRAVQQCSRPYLQQVNLITLSPLATQLSLGISATLPRHTGGSRVKPRGWSVLPLHPSPPFVLFLNLSVSRSLPPYDELIYRTLTRRRWIRLNMNGFCILPYYNITDVSAGKNTQTDAQFRRDTRTCFCHFFISRGSEAAGLQTFNFSLHRRNLIHLKDSMPTPPPQNRFE